jgi:hypothetical protein
MADEIREMVGEAVFDRLLEEVELRDSGATPVPHPALRRR